MVECDRERSLLDPIGHGIPLTHQTFTPPGSVNTTRHSAGNRVAGPIRLLDLYGASAPPPEVCALAQRPPDSGPWEVDHPANLTACIEGIVEKMPAYIH